MRRVVAFEAVTADRFFEVVTASRNILLRYRPLSG